MTEQLLSGWKIFSFWRRPAGQLHLSCFLKSHPGSSFAVFLGAIEAPVAGSRRSNKHPNREELGDDPSETLSVEINVSGKTNRPKIDPELVDISGLCGVEQI